MGEVTPRLKLPLMAAGQAQKEVTHNEALLLIDCVAMPFSQAAPQNLPPPAPVAGQCWMVGPSPSVAWAGEAHRLACWTDAGWRFADLPVGALVVEAGSGRRWCRISTGWQAPPTIAAASGGTVIDNECRTALAAIISALVGAGLITAS